MKLTYIIAEAGINHCGKVELAHKMIKIAKQAGADAIKFQTYITDKLVSRDAPLIKYQKDNIRSGNQYQMLKKCELSFNNFIELAAHCSEINIDFLSTPFDDQSADFLENLLDTYKIPSGEINNLPFLKRIAEKRKAIILSTGMSNMNEVKTATSLILDIQKKIGVKSKFPYPLSVLHCTSSYPCRFEDVNLKAMLEMKRKLKLPVGYSDHTPGVEVAAAVVALGAVIIEKHFTLDRSLPGPDHKASLTPSELRQLVSTVRNIEKVLGSGIKMPTTNELETMKGARKSIVAARDISKGSKITSDDICIKRPGTGLPPMMIEKIIGAIAVRGIAKDSPIRREDLKIRGEI